MIVVRVELHPWSGGKPRELGRLLIANDGTSTNYKRGHYDAAVMRAPKFNTVTRSGVVHDWPRQNKTVWQLVRQVLGNVYETPQDVDTDFTQAHVQSLPTPTPPGPGNSIPATAAQRIAELYGYDQVVVYAHRAGTGRLSGEHVTAYGIDSAHRGMPARIGKALGKFMGWDR